MDTSIKVIQEQNTLIEGLISRIDKLINKMYPAPIMPVPGEGGYQVTAPSSVMSVPVSYDTLRMVLSNSQGAVVPELTRKALSVVSGTEVAFNYPSRQGFNFVFTDPIIIRSSYHSTDVTMNYVVTRDRIVTRGPYPLSADFEFDARMFQHEDGFAPEYIQIKFSNTSTTDTVITIDAKGFFIEKGLFAQSILPILRNGFIDLTRYGEGIRSR